MEIRHSEHSARRSAQRGLSVDEIYYIIDHGQRYRRAGVVIYYLRERDVPLRDRADDRWAKLAGSAVVISKDAQTIITTWRNRKNGLKRIRRKNRYLWPTKEGEYERQASWCG